MTRSPLLRAGRARSTDRVVRRVGVASMALSLVVAGDVSAQLSDRAMADIEARARELVERPMIPGLAIGVVIGDSLVFARGFGVADRDTGRPITRESVFQIGSTSKTLTTTLLGILAERGVVGLDDPVTDHLPAELAYPAIGGRVATLRQIASHTAGLPRDAPTLRRTDGDAPILAFTHFELYQSIERAQLQFPPDSGWSYSNFGFGILGHALERASDQPFERLLFREIFAPLGMRSSTITLWPRFDDVLAKPYYPNNDTRVLEDYAPWDAEALAPGGGIASSLDDMARYLRLHMGGRFGTPEILSAEMLETLHRPRATLNDELSYGLGWFTRELAGFGPILEHGGEVDGYTSFFGFSREHEIGVIVLMNAGDGPVGDLAYWTFFRVLQDL